MQFPRAPIAEMPPARGLLEHLERHLGPVRRVKSTGADGYDLAFYESTEPAVTTVVTNGLRFQPVTSMLPEELVCSLLLEQAHIAHFLADSLAGLVVKNKLGLEYGSIFENNVPLVNETEMVGVIAHTNPLWHEDFNLYPSQDAPELQLISLVLVTRPEIDFVRSEGPDVLFEVFDLNRTKLADVRRRSAV